MAQHLLTGLLLQAGRESGTGFRPPPTASRHVAEAALARGAQLVPPLAELDELLLSPRTVVIEHPLEDAFAKLPEAVLLPVLNGERGIYCMRGADGNLLSRALIVVEGEGAERAALERGNALQQRLEGVSAEFHAFAQTPLEAQLPALGSALWHPRLGSLLDKVERLVALAPRAAAALRLSVTEEAARAALLCKSDTLAPLVGTYPTLRGRLASEVARVQGEAPQVAEALASHHAPFADEPSCAEDELGALLALCDRLDTLTTAFAFGLMPTPTADPLALRVHANGLLRTLMARGWVVDIAELVNVGLPPLEGAAAWLGREDTAIRVAGFLRHRLRMLLRRNYPDDLIHDAVMSRRLCPASVAQELAGVGFPPEKR